MHPEIRQYLDEHGEEYTPDALRRALLAAGHDRSAVEAALAEWRQARSGASGPSEAARGEDAPPFGLWAAAIHVAVFVLALVVIGVAGSAAPYLVFIAPILGIVMLLGWLVSTMIGRRFLPRSGVGPALVVPAVSALLIGGTCVAMGGLS